jgi:hypothetical protein
MTHLAPFHYPDPRSAGLGPRSFIDVQDDRPGRRLTCPTATGDHRDHRLDRPPSQVSFPLTTLASHIHGRLTENFTWLHVIYLTYLIFG